MFVYTGGVPFAQLLGHKQHARNTSFKVVSILTNLDSAKATGCDDLSVRFIEACPLAMAKLLTRVINKSISSCTFPIVTGNMLFLLQFQNLGIIQLVITNFHPISALPVFSNILEHVIHDQLVSYVLSRVWLVSPYQSGF